MEIAKCVIRDAAPDDERFVVGTWLSSFRRRCPHAELIDDDLYFSAHREVIRAVLAGDHVARVAELDGDLLGFAVARAGTLDYCYVTSPWRRLGVATELIRSLDLAEVVVQVSHYTESFRLLAESAVNRLRFKYNPYLWRKT